MAFWKAAKGKHGNKEVIHFKVNFEENIQKIQQQFERNNLDIGYYHFFYVYDHKKRLICAASFPERVIHHAIMNVCEPVLETYSISDSYACRKEKGPRKAVLRVQEYAREYAWFLKLDIRKYFDSVDHSILFQLLSRRFKEKPLLELFRQLLETYQLKKGKGLPIGNLVSQHRRMHFIHHNSCICRIIDGHILKGGILFLFVTYRWQRILCH